MEVNSVIASAGVFFVALYLLALLLPRKIVDIRKTGKWAVVTGATDGIGKCFCHELAKLGMNVVLVSRNLEKLTNCASEINKTFLVSTKTIQADFTSSDANMYAEIEKQLNELDVGVLVNNVGMMMSHPEYFHLLGDHHEEEYGNLINCNIISAVQMTRIVLGGMVSRRRGLIINISSVTSLWPSPLLTLYSASKSFLAKFSRDLDLEVREKGVHVHVLRTGYVETKLSGINSFYGIVPTPEVYVKSALKEVTTSRDTDGYFGHWVSRLGFQVALLLFPWGVEKITRSIYYRVKNERTAECQKCSNPKISSKDK